MTCRYVKFPPKAKVVGISESLPGKQLRPVPAKRTYSFSELSLANQAMAREMFFDVAAPASYSDPSPDDGYEYTLDSNGNVLCRSYDMPMREVCPDCCQKFIPPHICPSKD